MTHYIIENSQGTMISMKNSVIEIIKEYIYFTTTYPNTKLIVFKLIKEEIK